jgi:hypothetical protein
MNVDAASLQARIDPLDSGRPQPSIGSKERIEFGIGQVNAHVS